MNTNNVNSPKRRFRSFEGEWEQRKLGNIASMHARIGWQNLRTSEFLDNGDYYLITGTDFLNGRINFEKCHYVNKERYQQDKKIQVGKGSILITKDGTLGKVALVTDLNKPATLNAGVFNVVVKVPSINETYLYQYLAAPFLMDYVSKRATGGTIKHLNQGILVEFPVDIPSYKEQVTIGQFLVCLDNAVTLHQHKLDKLKDLKQAYLTEMFPVEGERVPKRRFPGFEGEWEWKKLGELATIVRGASPRPIQDPKWFDSESEVGWLRISDVTEQNGRIYKLSQRLSSLGQETTRVVSEPHLILSIAATVGKPVINYVRTGIHDGFLIFQEPKFEIEYMYYLLGMFRKNWASYGQPGSQLNLNSDIVKEQRVAIPSQSEQVEISKFFNKLDQSISLQQQKLDKLNDLKKAYLNELFV